MNRAEIYKIIRTELEKEGLSKKDWNDFILAINAPSNLNGIFNVAQSMTIITKKMCFPIVRKDDEEWINKLNQHAIIIDNNLMLLQSKFGSAPIKIPHGNAQNNPLYYALFYECKPGTESQFYFLLMWMFIAFFKEPDDKSKTLNSHSLYLAFLGLRGLFDELTSGNPLSNLKLELATMNGVAEDLRCILSSINALDNMKTCKNLRSIISLLYPHPKKSNETNDHSEHQRTHSLPTPRRGYLPLTARFVNLRSCFPKNKKWSPQDVSITDIQDQNFKEESSNAFHGGSQTRHSLIQSPGNLDSPPELFIFKMKSLANAIARNNQTIPFKSSTPITENVFDFLSFIQSDDIPMDICTVFSLNILTGIPIENLTGMPFIESIDEIETRGILFVPQESCLFLPVRKPARKTSTDRNAPTHFPLKIPRKLIDLLLNSHTERRHYLDEAFLDTDDQGCGVKRRKKQPRLFPHQPAYYKKWMQGSTNLIKKNTGIKISGSSVENTVIKIGLHLGIDPIILSQITQKDVARSETQSHYTRISCDQIQISYDLIISEFFSLNQGRK